MTEQEIMERRAAQAVFAHLKARRHEEITRLTAIRDALRVKVRADREAGKDWAALCVEVVP